MELFKDTDKYEKRPVFIIAEIGQNHQGDKNIAKKLILTAKNEHGKLHVTFQFHPRDDSRVREITRTMLSNFPQCGVDCVKFQKTCLEEKFTKAALNKPYKNENSWGTTYGEHKTFLEFSEDDFTELQKYASDLGIIFTASAMDIVSLNFLVKMNVPFIKLGSGDANNYLLIEQAAKTQIPLIISTGMQNLQTIKNIYEIVSVYHKKFALLHCISAYPVPYNQINLKIISLYREMFPDIVIGYSGHEVGIHVTLAAVALGAKVIERHITLNKTQKGSDHKCSLEPNEFEQLVKSIRDIEAALGGQTKELQECELPCYKKLGKCLVYAKNLTNGHVLQIDDLKIKVTGEPGIDGSNLFKIIGKMVVKDVEYDTPVLYTDF